MASVIRGGDNFDSFESSGLGVNQTWQDVTASRSSGVDYTNTTGKPILVLISVEGVWEVLVDSVSISINQSSTARGTPSFVVPDSATYNVTCTGITKWSELR